MSERRQALPWTAPSQTPGPKCAGLRQWRETGTEHMQGYFLTGLDRVVCFMPKSEQKALGFAHNIHKGQSREVHEKAAAKKRRAPPWVQTVELTSQSL